MFTGSLIFSFIPSFFFPTFFLFFPPLFLSFLLSFSLPPFILFHTSFFYSFILPFFFLPSFLPSFRLFFLPSLLPFYITCFPRSIIPFFQRSIHPSIYLYAFLLSSFHASILPSFLSSPNITKLQQTLKTRTVQMH